MKNRLLVGCLGTALLIAGSGCSGGGGDARGGSRGDGTLVYAALGDSFTSAPGVPTMTTGNGCQRSDHNYPALVAAQLHAQLHDASCGSATNDAVRQVQPAVSPPPEPQLTAVTADTDLVTVSLGLNDLSFFYDMVISCPALAQAQPTGAPCTDADDASPYGTLTERLPAIQQRLQDTLAAVGRAGPDATLVVVGYPQLVPAHGTCPALPIPAADYPLYRKAFEGLAQVMGEAAEAEGALFVDVLSASEGHDVCSEQPWVNGAVAASDATAYHPFPAEQQAIADLVVSAYRS